MNSSDCICQSITSMSISALDAMDSKALIAYEGQLSSQQNCQHTNMLRQEVERCEQRLMDKAERNDPAAQHWKLDRSLPSQKMSQCVVKI